MTQAHLLALGRYVIVLLLGALVTAILLRRPRVSIVVERNGEKTTCVVAP